MFGVNAYATVWTIDREKNTGKISTSNKNKEGGYWTDFNNSVAFVGKAKEKLADLSEKERIKITACGVVNKLENGEFRKYPRYVIFDFEPLEPKNSQQSGGNVADDDEEPF